ncbi:prolyl oligopeptidase family serine peptidase [Lignipirellula cremea]|uniref:Prolyl tripeptidyl peptidase n=1 Tax=Lignipirellula cremea TaxID=2528010 RepID=A0A518DYR7_9BACT|nr:prolyl oligopeptidase family serine peptidase [Lignipirellula cremea]QDU96990.1 Prolyl tripeptidyl peptidase precursor [Lignipirellula cremea]
MQPMPGEIRILSASRPHPRRLIGLLLLAGSLSLLFASPLLGQGTRADYERAAGLRKRYEHTLFRDKVEPHWLDANSFWYKVQTGPQQHEFILCELGSCKREPLFDHGKLAEQLSALLGRPIDAKALPLESLTVEEGDPRHLSPQVEFVVARRRFHYDVNRKKLEDLSATVVPPRKLPPLRVIPAATRQDGFPTEILFRNLSPQPVQLFWRNREGERQKYGTIPAGGERLQPTFAGHVWEATDQQDRSLVGFMAREAPGRAVIAKDVRPLEDERPASGGRDGSVSPDGRWRVRFQDHNVFLQSLPPEEKESAGEEPDSEQPEEFRLTRDGEADDAYGGKVYWSPDSRQFVVLQTKAPQQHPVHLIESTPADQLQPKLHTRDYLKPGDRIRHPRPRLFDAQSRQAVPVADDLFAQPWSIQDLRWDQDSQRFTFLYNQRGHQVLRLVAVDNQGQATALIEETSPTFIDYHSKLYCRRLEATNEILWMSERDGWNHLWLYDATTGKVKQQLTQGDWAVSSVESIDEERREIWFMAGGVRPEQDPYYQHLCRVGLDGGDFTILTEGNGTHEITFSPDRTWFLDKWSRVDLPPTFEMRQSEDGRRVALLEQADDQALLAAGWTPPERFVAPGRDGQTPIYGILIRPSNFDPKKRYPVVEQVYAGPHGFHTPKAYGLLIGQHAMAELGFIVVQIDGMGTNGRSKKFHDVCWQNLADAGFPDRIAWIKAAAATRPWMDLEHVGIYGGSAGGQNAMRALLDHHDFYHAAVADCGCHDNRMDKIWWNELWMGHPVGPQYAASSNAVHADRLAGKLMLIVGELDKNVDPSSTMQVVKALQQADKDFDLVIVAGAGHGAAETRYGSRRRSDFLVRHLHGREPRSDSDEPQGDSKERAPE